MNNRDPWANLSAAFAEEFGSAPEIMGALADAVAANRMELDALADEYQREQIASAQSEDAYQANVRSFNK